MDDEFPQIHTGNGIDRDQAATTNDRLKKSVIATRELQDAVTELNSTIKTSSKETSRQTNQLIILTKWIVGLTVVLIVGLVVQIALALIGH